MWIVRLALRRPYTFVVMGLAIVLLGVSAIVTTPTDIFPEIDIPVVSVIWNYDGLTTEDMASRITTFSEYTISSAVSDVRQIESQTYPGVGVIKIYFQPNVNVEAALAQRSEEHTSELQSQSNLVCRLLLEKKKKKRRLKTTRCYTALA